MRIAALISIIGGCIIALGNGVLTLAPSDYGITVAPEQFIGTMLLLAGWCSLCIGAPAALFYAGYLLLERYLLRRQQKLGGSNVKRSF